LPGKVNYFLGNDPTSWHTDVSTFAQVKYPDLYPGIDLLYYGNQRQLEYDFIVAPGANPNMIQLGFQGADDLELDDQGNLILRIGEDQIQMHKPLMYQEVDGVRHEIAGGYFFISQSQVGFQVAAYDRAKALIIDPTLVYSTYLGGSSEDIGFSIAVDVSGSAYITGYTASVDFPTSGAAQPASGGSLDAFVTKLNSTGSAFVYSTYFGGSNSDQGRGIAVDNAGNAYVTGVSESVNFPTTNARDSAIGGSQDAFVAKLNSTGSALIYSTFLGGNHGDRGLGIALDADDNVYVTGMTLSSDFPTAHPIQPAHGGGNCATPPSMFPCSDAFVTKLDAAGSTLVYSTYLGGSGEDIGNSIAVDAFGNVYLNGATTSTNFPTVYALQSVHQGGVYDAFVSKIEPLGSTLLYSTYLGGGDDDYGNAIAVDAAGSAVVTGNTRSVNFPTYSPFQPVIGASNGFDAFLTKLNPAGSSLAYSTYLGGQGDDLSYDIAVDNLGNTYVTGLTRSLDFPLANPFQPVSGGVGPFSGEAFVLKMKPSGSALVYSSFLGGSGDENAFGGGFCGAIAADTLGNAYLTGCTNSTNFSTAGSAQPTRGGGFDAFVVKIADNQPPTADAGGPYVVMEGNSTIVRASATDPENGPIAFEWDLDNNGSFETPGQNASFSAAELDVPGTHTVTVQVTDNGGLSTTDQATVTVIYNFIGYFQPVDNLPVLNVANAGRAIPVKFSLHGNHGLDIIMPGYPNSAQVTCGYTAEDAIEETVTAGSSSLSYNASTDQYTYVWKTEKAWTGTCRTLVIRLNDGTVHRANFKFK